MLDDLKETLDKGIDYAFMTTEKITKAAKKMAKENNLTTEDGKKLLDYLQKRSDETRKMVEGSLQDFVKSSLKKMDVPTKAEMKRLETRIKELEAANKKAAPKKKVAPKKKAAPRRPAAKKTTAKTKK